MISGYWGPGSSRLEDLCLGGMTRISDDSLGLNGYATHAGLGTFGPNTVTFNLIRMTNGVISGGPSDTSDTNGQFGPVAN